MGTLYIRGIDDSVLVKLDDLARAKGMSRNAYVKKYVESLSVLSDLKDMGSRYTVLVKNISPVLKQNIDFLNKNEKVLIDIVNLLNVLYENMKEGKIHA